MKQQTKSQIVSRIDRTLTEIQKGTGFFPLTLKRDELVAALILVQKAKDILTPRPKFARPKRISGHPKGHWEDRDHDGYADTWVDDTPTKSKRK
jgi:hypothetical protein